MEMRALTPGLSVTGQITPADMPQIADQGFRAIICNRPDGEEADQPSFGQVEHAARAAGLEVKYLPISHDDLTAPKAQAFAKLLADLPGPVLAYCRSGMRSATLWSMAQSHQDHLAP